MNKFFNPDPLEFEKLEKERVIKKLEKAIKKAESEGTLNLIPFEEATKEWDIE